MFFFLKSSWRSNKQEEGEEGEVVGKEGDEEEGEEEEEEEEGQDRNNQLWRRILFNCRRTLLSFGW